MHPKTDMNVSAGATLQRSWFTISPRMAAELWTIHQQEINKLLSDPSTIRVQLLN